MLQNIRALIASELLRDNQQGKGEGKITLPSTRLELTGNYSIALLTDSESPFLKPDTIHS